MKTLINYKFENGYVVTLTVYTYELDVKPIAEYWKDTIQYIVNL